VVLSCDGPNCSPCAGAGIKLFEASAVEAGRSTGAPFDSSEEGGGGRATAAVGDGGVPLFCGRELLVSAVLKSLALLVGADAARGEPRDTPDIGTSANSGDFSDEARTTRVGHHQTDRLLVCKTPLGTEGAGDGIRLRAGSSDQYRVSLDPPLPLAPLISNKTPPAAGVKAADIVRFNQGVGGRTGGNVSEVDTDGRRRLLFRGVLTLLQKLFDNEKQARATDDGTGGETGRVVGAGAGFRLRASGQHGMDGVWVSAGTSRCFLAVLFGLGLMVHPSTAGSSFVFVSRALKPAEHSVQLVLTCFRNIQFQPTSASFLFKRCDRSRHLRIFSANRNAPLSCKTTSL